jgi:low affinity Fe/Cu permease
MLYVLVRFSPVHNHLIGIDLLTVRVREEIRVTCEQAAKRHDEASAESTVRKAASQKRTSKKHVA